MKRLVTGFLSLVLVFSLSTTSALAVSQNNPSLGQYAEEAGEKLVEAGNKVIEYSQRSFERVYNSAKDFFHL